MLVTAHHLNDQTETFFLSPKTWQWAKRLRCNATTKCIIRNANFTPVVRFYSPTVRRLCAKEKLNWITDESNEDNRYDRNFLRNEILPELRERWAYFDLAVQRSAQHCFEQQQLINDLLSETFAQHCQIKTNLNCASSANILSQNKPHFCVCGLLKTNLKCQVNASLHSLLMMFFFAKEEANPQFQLVNKVIRRYQDSLYLTKRFSDLTKCSLKLEQNTLNLPDDLGNLTVQENEHNLIFYWQDYSVTLEKRTCLFLFVLAIRAK